MSRKKCMLMILLSIVLLSVSGMCLPRVEAARRTCKVILDYGNDDVPNEEYTVNVGDRFNPPEESAFSKRESINSDDYSLDGWLVNGKVFNGWKKNGDENNVLYSFVGQVITDDTVYTAVWSDIYRVSIDMGEGRFDGRVTGEIIERDWKGGSSLILDYGKIIYPEGKAFAGFQINDDEKLFSREDLRSYIVNDNINLKAVYKDACNVTYDPGEENKLVDSYRKNGIGWVNHSNPFTKQYAMSQCGIDMDIATYKDDTKKFLCWKSSVDGKLYTPYELGHEYQVVGDVSFLAQYSDSCKVTFNPGYGYIIGYKESFDKRVINGFVPTSIDDYSNTGISRLSVSERYEDYVAKGHKGIRYVTVFQNYNTREKTFVGWKSSDDGNIYTSQQIETEYEVTGDVTFTAQYDETLVNGDEDSEDDENNEDNYEKVFVTINTNGGHFLNYDELSVGTTLKPPSQNEYKIVELTKDKIVLEANRGSTMAFVSSSIVVDIDNDQLCFKGWRSSEDSQIYPVYDGFDTYYLDCDVTFDAVWDDAVIITYDYGNSYFDESVSLISPNHKEKVYNAILKAKRLKNYIKYSKTYIYKEDGELYYCGYSIPTPYYNGSDGMFRFDQWVTADGEALDIYTNTESVTLYPSWKLDDSANKVTYKASEGLLKGGFGVFVDDDGNTVYRLGEPSDEIVTSYNNKSDYSYSVKGIRDGYYLIGWIEESTGNEYTVKDMEKGNKGPAGIDPFGKTYIAKWEKIVTITFDSGIGDYINAGSSYVNCDGRLNAVSKIYGVKFGDDSNIPNTIGYSNEWLTPSLEGDVFVGWRYDGGSTIYSPGEIKRMSFDNDTKFIAVYKSEVADLTQEDDTTCTIVFNSVDGYIEGDANKKSVTKEVTKGEIIFNGEPTDKGYFNMKGKTHSAFKGWKNISTGDVYEYLEVYNYPVTEDVTFEAVWVDAYDIKYYSEEGYIGGDPNCKEDVYQIEVGKNLGGNYGAHNREGYAFTGWKSSVSGGIYQNDELYSYIPTSDEVFVAQWANGVKVVLDANGGYFDNTPGSWTTLNYEIVVGGTIESDSYNLRPMDPVSDQKGDFIGWTDREIDRIYTTEELKKLSINNFFTIKKQPSRGRLLSFFDPF